MIHCALLQALEQKSETFLRKLVRSVSTVFQDGPEARRSSGTAAGSRWPMLQRELSTASTSFTAAQQLSSPSQRPPAVQRVNLLGLAHDADDERPNALPSPASAARLVSPCLSLRSKSLFVDDGGAGNGPGGNRGSGVPVTSPSQSSPPTRGEEADPESVPEPVEQSRGSASSLLHRVGAGSRNLRASVSWAGAGALERDRTAAAAAAAAVPVVGLQSLIPSNICFGARGQRSALGKGRGCVVQVLGN